MTTPANTPSGADRRRASGKNNPPPTRPVKARPMKVPSRAPAK
jgi:hypothetical protein